MKLYYQTHSPYARKALVFAYEAGLPIVSRSSTTRQARHAAMTSSLPKILWAKFRFSSGRDSPPLFNSDVICAYFDTLSQGARLDPARR